MQLTRMRVPPLAGRLTGSLQVTGLQPGKIERSAEALWAATAHLLSLQSKLYREGHPGDRVDKPVEGGYGRVACSRSA